jgi:polysaccharide biosynthesis protein PslH
MHILFISPYVPSPIRVRPYNFIRALVQRGHDITLVCSTSAGDQEALNELRQICHRVVGVPLGSKDMLFNAIRALPSDLPLQAALNFDRAMIEAIRTEVRSTHFDAAHIEHLRGSALANALGNTPVLLDSVDSISLLFDRTLRSGPSLKSRIMAFIDIGRTRRYEAEYTARYDRVVVSSPEDAQALEQLQTRFSRKKPHTKAIVVANGVDLHYFAPQDAMRDTATLVFSGKMGYHANEAAALFLVNEIMPRVWAQQPQVQVVIAGSSPPKSLLDLASDQRVTVTGFLPDLRPAIARATMAVCPLRYGVGIQNKVLEAMAMATPVIAARQVANAIAAVAGQDLLLAEQPGEYAQAILRLLADPQQAYALGQAGRAYVEQHHNWNAAAAKLEQLYGEIAQARSAMREYHGQQSHRSAELLN